MVVRIKQRRRTRQGPSATWLGLASIDRFIIRFFNRRGMFVPDKGHRIRSRSDLDAVIAELGDDWQNVITEGV